MPEMSAEGLDTTGSDKSMKNITQVDARGIDLVRVESTHNRLLCSMGVGMS